MLDDKIKMMIDELGIHVQYWPKLDANGHYIARINTIVIDDRLPLHSKVMTLLHELGHASKHQNNYELYNLAFSLHSKMENEAEEFMIEKMIELRVDDPEFNPATFNAVNFLESNEMDLKYESVVKEFMTSYFISNSLEHIFF